MIKLDINLDQPWWLVNLDQALSTSIANNIDINHEQDLCQPTIRCDINIDLSGQLDHVQAWYQPRSTIMVCQPWSSIIHINREQHWYQAWTRLMSTMIKHGININLASQLNHDQSWWSTCNVHTCSASTIFFLVRFQRSKSSYWTLKDIQRKNFTECHVS